MCAPLPVEGREHKKMSHVPPVLPKMIKMETNNNVCAARGQSCGQETALSCRRAHTRDTSSTWRLTAGVTPEATCWEGTAVAKLQPRPCGSPSERKPRTQPCRGPLRTCLYLPFPTTHSGGRELWHG